MSDQQLDEVDVIIEEVFGHVQYSREYAEDLRLALHSAPEDGAGDAPLTLLPILSCEAVGGDAHRATPLAAAWCLLFLAARILDDLEDKDADNALWTAIGPARAINVATGLILAAPLALAYLHRWDVEDSIFFTLHEHFHRTALRICAGQHSDLTQQAVCLEEYWRMAGAKAGEPFALACRAGALVGGGNGQQVALLGEFGHNLGLLTQIGDDFHGVWGLSGRSDLAAGRRTLPILYALTVAPIASRELLRDLLARATENAEAGAQACQIITEMGALHYLLTEAELRRQRARGALEAARLSSCALHRLRLLLDQAAPWGEAQTDESTPGCSGR